MICQDRLGTQNATKNQSTIMECRSPRRRPRLLRNSANGRRVRVPALHTQTGSVQSVDVGTVQLRGSQSQSEAPLPAIALGNLKLSGFAAEFAVRPSTCRSDAAAQGLVVR